MSHDQVVAQGAQSLQNVGVTRCEMCQSVLGEGDYSGTVVHLDSTDEWWRADNFKKWIQAAFPHGRWANIRIQSLTFNGETVFDYRLWPEPPDLTGVVADLAIAAFPKLRPITIKVRTPNIPEWKER